MKRNFAILTILFIPVGMLRATILFRNSATNITSGVLNPARVSPSTFTLLGPNPAFGAFSGAIGSSQIVSGATLMSTFNESVAIGNANTFDCVGTGIACTQSGTTTTITVSAVSAGPATVAGSTHTMTFKIPAVYVSTIDVCGIQTACHTVGPSTFTIVGYWADAYRGSTVGYTGIQFAVSTGGVNGAPAPSRFNGTTISLTTATSAGNSTYTGFTATNVVIRAGETFGVMISSFANSGILTQGLMVHVDYWEVGRY